MAITLTPTTVPARPTQSLWRAGLTAGVVAAAATTTIAAVGATAGVSFETAPGDAIPTAGFAQLTIFFTVVGIGIASLIRRRSAQPRSTFTRVAIALTALSVVPDLTMPFDAGSRITLVLTHLVAASIVVPAIARRLEATTR